MLSSISSTKSSAFSPRLPFLLLLALLYVSPVAAQLFPIVIARQEETSTTEGAEETGSVSSDVTSSTETVTTTTTSTSSTVSSSTSSSTRTSRESTSSRSSSDEVPTSSSNSSSSSEAQSTSSITSISSSTSPLSTSTSVTFVTSKTPATTPATTLIVRPSSNPTTETPSDTSTPVPIGATANGFWANRSAVAGTFSVVALVVIALLVGAWTLLMKRRRRKYLDDSAFERYPEPDNNSGNVSPGPSTVELHQQAPMDAFENPGNYYHQHPQFMDQPSQQMQMQPHAYSDYPQTQYTPNQHQYYGTEYQHGGNTENLPPPSQNTPSPTQQAYMYLPPSSRVMNNNPFSDVNTNAGKLAPVSFRQPMARDSAYQPSIDSFYGAQGAPGQAS